MSREIKFRVYDKCHDAMYCQGKEVRKIEFDFKTKMLSINGLEGVLDCEDEIEAVLMQYTGVKDKNDKEIYEGDILQDEENMLWEVIFDDGAFGVENSHIPGRRFINTDLEIIGNIYEDPNLLKEN